MMRLMTPESRTPQHEGWGLPKLMLWLLGIFLLLQSPVESQAKEIRRVLIFNELGLWSPGVNAVDQEIFVASQKSSYQIEFYTEDLDTSLFPDKFTQREFRDWYFRKYRNRKPDLIIVVGPSALKFIADNHEEFSPDTPVVFCGYTEELAKAPKFDSHFTGVWAVAQPNKTLDAALQLQPGTKHVVVVGGVAPYDRQLEALVNQTFRGYESRLDFTYLTDLAMPTLLERLKHLPSNTIVYHTSIMRDGAGEHFIDAVQSAPMVASASNAPVFAVDDVDVGRGTVGGYVFSFASQGRIAAEMVIRILDGEKPQDIPIVRSANIYMFDWRALQRWGLKEGNLPPGSIVLFRELSIWERAKSIWVTVLIVIVGLSLLAGYLQYSRKQLEMAKDKHLQLSGMLINAQEKERGRLASELHDDFSQRLALLAIGLENAAEAIRISPQEANRQLHELLNSASEIGADLHTLSHRLHSSTLESLGLVPGVSAFCKEFQTQQGLQVEFTHDGFPRSIHSDVALCVFRIVQEALRNIKKHSGATKAHVRLEITSDRVHVCVLDDGVGFPRENLRSKGGLGVRSMEERARLLGGRFEIRSQPQKGTSVDAWLPLQPVQAYEGSQKTG